MNLLQAYTAQQVEQLELYQNVLRCCGYTPEKVKAVTEMGGARHLEQQLCNLRGHVSYLYHHAPGWK
ncbi:hypothetical protein EXN57_02730 [Clostridium botulinum]|uniref:hypothetical protein n=1 Tax=Clostridium TaxID=1485 RepID=UPI000D222DC2|nr:hypothetical protein [Clostridium sporogenes]AVP61710.1 hypothetical protein C7M79_13830 [Clostridium botulinum]NFD30436.1 hypothetical protein [Clostridium botulinum]NFD32730.1 hypothetical protein [Clostridium botulinum]NFD58469.1 hypothetical protein [Clostridium botulinum]NFE00259.1 hypothetical protein [Clostridium botulinum]